MDYDNSMTMNNGEYFGTCEHPYAELTGEKILRFCQEQLRDITKKMDVMSIEALVGDMDEEGQKVKFSFYYEPKADEPGCYTVVILSLFVDGCEILTDMMGNLREQLAEALELHLMEPRKVDLFETMAKQFKPIQ